MSTARQHPRTGLLGGAALLLVLLGVLAMHGLGGHAAGHGAVSPPHGAVTAQSGGHPDAGSAGHHGSAADIDSVVTVTVQHLATDAPHPAWWTTLCLAIVAGTVLLLVGRRTGAPVRVSLSKPAAGTRVPASRDRDPPSLVVLSVRRC